MWTPELGARQENVPTGVELVPDKRALHYWNPSESVGKAYGQILQTPGPAWDVYFLFRRGVRWTGKTPPTPDFWMHQLGGVNNAPRLDPDVFKQHVDELLKT